MTAVRVYIDPGFAVQANGTVGEYTIFGLPDSPYLQINSLLPTQLPPNLECFVLRVTLVGQLLMRYTREAGIYRHGLTEITLRHAPPSKSGSMMHEYRLEGEGSYPRLRELYLAIEAGTVRPVASFDCPQEGPSRADLLKQVEDLDRAVKRLEGIATSALESCRIFNDSYYKLIGETLKYVMEALEMVNVPWLVFLTNQGDLRRYLENVVHGFERLQSKGETRDSGPEGYPVGDDSHAGESNPESRG